MAAKSKHVRHRRIPVNDTLVSGEMLMHAVDAILRRIRLDRDHDIPYLAGYSRDGRNIYIDRHIPKFMKVGGKRFNTDRFLILHEAVEKSLLMHLGLRYQHAHQIALRAEKAAVAAAGVPWRAYDNFMQAYIKEVGDEKLMRIPLDLDIKPYRDEHDHTLLVLMQQSAQLEQLQQMKDLPQAVRDAIRSALCAMGIR